MQDVSKRKPSNTLSGLNKRARETGRYIREHLDKDIKVIIPRQPVSRDFRPGTFGRFRDKSGKLKGDKTINSTYRRSWKGQDELFSTAKTREIVKGMFNKVFPVDLTKTEAEVLSELVDLVSSIRMPTYMSGFATKDRVMQHPANRKLAYFGDPRNTASLHSQMDTKRRQYVQRAMDMAQNRGDSSQEIIESGARAAIEFTLNYFTAPVTANNVFQYTQKSATVLSDPPNQRQLAERERLKRIYENLGGKLRPQPWSSSSATETQEESWTRKWGLSHDPLEDSLSVLEAPPSPRRFPRLSPNQLEEYGVNNQKKLQTLGFAE